MERRKLYLSASNYNMIRLQDAVEAFAKKDGAQIVKNPYKKEIISFYNRSITEKIQKNNSLIEALEKHEKNAEHLKKENKTLENDFELSKYETLASSYTWGGVSVRFVKDGVYYEFSQEDNPFFPAHVRKIKLDENNSYIGDFYCDTQDEHPYFYDDIFSINCSDETLADMAQELYQHILKTAFSQEYIERTKKRVPNYYNSGYHYETIIKRSNKKTILEFV